MTLSPGLLSQIDSLSESTTSSLPVSLQGLVSCALSKLSKTTCTSISLVYNGGESDVFKLEFCDRTKVIALISNQSNDSFQPGARRSEIVTMEFVCESSLYPAVRLPEVYASDETFSNPVGAPYVLMELLEGRNMIAWQKETQPNAMPGLSGLEDEDQKAVLRAIANLQAALSRPVPFTKIGSLIRTEDGSFEVGPMEHGRTSPKLDPAGGPYSSMEEMWYGLIEREVRTTVRDWPALATSDDGSTPLPLSEAVPEEHTLEEFAALAKMLIALVPHFVPPPPFRTLVLHHPDVALRNLLFDPEDHSKIVGVLDWNRTQVLPIILASRFPDDLITRSWFPYVRAGYPTGEDWETVPHDWATVGEPRERDGDWYAEEMMTFAQAQVKLFFQRSFFMGAYARAMMEREGGRDITYASGFPLAHIYLMFHETLVGGVESWFQHRRWIEETYKRAKTKAAKLDRLLVGDNTYNYSTLLDIRDLGERDVSLSYLTTMLQEAAQSSRKEATR